MKNDSKFLSVLTSVLLVLFLLSGGIAVPILFRPFYYSQIGALSLPARTGFSPQVIRGAFDAVMDYLVKGAPFGTGALRWSDSGMAHFADCKSLFQLDFLVLGVSAILLLLIGILVLTGRLRLHWFAGRGPCFWACVGMGVALALAAAWALLDFQSLFTAFHTLFFPGKTNWIFDYRADQIILILPEDFWARAAALVGGLAFGAGILMAVAEDFLRSRLAPSTVYEEIQRMRR